MRPKDKDISPNVSASSSHSITQARQSARYDTALVLMTSLCLSTCKLTAPSVNEHCLVVTFLRTHPHQVQSFYKGPCHAVARRVRSNIEHHKPPSWPSFDLTFPICTFVLLFPPPLSFAQPHSRANIGSGANVVETASLLTATSFPCQIPEGGWRKKKGHRVGIGTLPWLRSVMIFGSVRECVCVCVCFYLGELHLRWRQRRPWA